MLVFVGWYGRGNSGDEAFKEVHERLFPGIPKIWLCDEEFTPSPDDVYVLGGGDVFLDYYICRLPKDAPFFAYGVGLTSPDWQDKVLDYRDRLKGIWLRNREDAEYLKARGLNAHFTPDITFQLKEPIAAEPDPMPDWPPPGEKLLVVMPSNNAQQDAARNGKFAEYFYQEYMKFKFASELDELAKYYSILLLPLSFDSNDMDVLYCHEIASMMQRRRRVRIAEQSLPPLKTARLVAKADLVLSMKFHGLMYATMGGVPFVNIGLTRKTEMYCLENGFSEFSLPPYSFSRDPLVERVKRAEKPETRPYIEARATALAEEATRQGAAFVQSVQDFMKKRAS